MQHRIIAQSILLFLLTVCLVLAIQKPIEVPKTKLNKNVDNLERVARIKRATRKPGFFRTLFSVIYEQWNDTRHTVGNINRMINDNFLPENQPVTEFTTAISNPNVSTTEAPYKITRTEFNKIIRRNLRGLQRLYNIELQEALKQSKIYNREFQKNATREISKFL